MRLLDKSRINKILVVSLSNIGDVILTLPVVDVLKRDFPETKISIIIGQKAESLLKGSPVFENVYIYNKHQPRLDTLKWIMRLRKERFDLAVDLRNSAIPFLIASKFRTPLHIGRKEKIHMKLKHLKRLKMVHPFEEEAQDRISLCIPPEDRLYVQGCLQEKIGQDSKYVVMAPGSADQAKRWSTNGFARVADAFRTEHNLKTIFLGDRNDNQVVQAIQKLMITEAVNLCGQSSLIQTAEFVRRSELAVVNDSAVLHMASYLDRPVIALFGYTDPSKYGPWSKTGMFLKASGRPVTMENTTQEKIDFIESIKPEDVLRYVRMNAGEIGFIPK
ncbi:MAG: glycosyltransferase family 9 protein [Candidatus Omnitrophota bacterium]